MDKKVHELYMFVVVWTMMSFHVGDGASTSRSTELPLRGRVVEDADPYAQMLL